jgi:uroporphyrin-III C-methyltransferase/precorrin-2 dehydrogenase/sirohydrochlorin ferrochelatase
LCEQLIAHGMPADMPAAVVQQATLPEQRVVVAPLAELARRVEEAQLHPPTLVIVGDVVRLREKLAWFESAAQRGSAVPELGAHAASAREPSPHEPKTAQDH